MVFDWRQLATKLTSEMGTEEDFDAVYHREGGAAFQLAYGLNKWHMGQVARFLEAHPELHSERVCLAWCMIFESVATIYVLEEPEGEPDFSAWVAWAHSQSPT